MTERADQQTLLEINENTACAYGLRYLISFAKVRGWWVPGVQPSGGSPPACAAPDPPPWCKRARWRVQAAGCWHWGVPAASRGRHWAVQAARARG